MLEGVVIHVILSNKVSFRLKTRKRIYPCLNRLFVSFKHPKEWHCFKILIIGLTSAKYCRNYTIHRFSSCGMEKCVVACKGFLNNALWMRIDVHGVVTQEADEGDAAVSRQFDRQAGRGGDGGDTGDTGQQGFLDDLE
jgi:hypothetical protein